MLAPGLRRVAATLKAHGAIIEVSASRRPRPAASPHWPPLLNTPCGPVTAQWPSKAWLAEKFPGGSWSVDAADTFASKWFAYANSWEALLSAWEDEVFTVMWTEMPLPLPGLVECLE